MFFCNFSEAEILNRLATGNDIILKTDYQNLNVYGRHNGMENRSGNFDGENLRVVNNCRSIADFERFSRRIFKHNSVTWTENIDKHSPCAKWSHKVHIVRWILL